MEAVQALLCVRGQPRRGAGGPFSFSAECGAVGAIFSRHFDGAFTENSEMVPPI